MPETQRLHLFMCRRLAKCSETLPNIIWVQCSRMDATQLRCPKKCIQGRNTSFASFYVPKVSEMLRNTPNHLFGSNIVEWVLLNFGAPKKCIQARNTSFASFYVPKVSEMLWNTPKHHFQSNVVEWMLRNCYPEIVHLGPKHEFFIFLGLKVSEMI
jgi:hypothetical protein